MAIDVQVSRNWLLAREQEGFRQRERRRQVARAALCTAVCAVAPRYPQVDRAFLFGSVTRPGGLNETSDLDVAVEGVLGAEDFFALWRELERAVDSWPVDLVELDRRSVHFVQRVRETGELIYERKAPDSQG
jgi:predicted nucleotidyltransferase